MKLSEAIHVIRTEFPHTRTSTEEGGKAIRLTLVSMGESHLERFMGQLQNSIFGLRFLDVQYSGGRDEYVIPLDEMDRESGWFDLSSPSPNPTPPFANIETEEYEVVAVPTVKYVYVKKENPRDAISWKVRGFIDALVGEYGKEAVEQALENPLSTSTFYGDTQFKVTFDAIDNSVRLS